MTIDERFERIEHVTAGIAEQRRQDREEFRQIWRDTQRQINENTANIAALTLKLADTNDAIARTNANVDRLSSRVEALVSAIGQNLSLEHHVASLEAALPKPAPPQA